MGYSIIYQFTKPLMPDMRYMVEEFAYDKKAELLARYDMLKADPDNFTDVKIMQEVDRESV